MPVLLFILGLLSLFPIAKASEDPFRFVVFAYDAPERVEREFRPILQELSLALSAPVELAILSMDEIEAALAARRVDLLLTNPTHFFTLRATYALPSPHATLVRIDNGRLVDQLAGVILARRGQAPQHLTDLEGKTILIPEKRFLGGYQAQAYELYQAGVDINAITWREVGSHLEVFRRLAAGEGDYGFIRSGLWERYQQLYPELAERLEIIFEKKHPDFPFRASTRLYPEWPLVILPHVSDDDAYRILTHLLALHLRVKAYRPEDFLRAGIAGFVRARDYEPVRLIARAMREPPFVVAEFDWLDIWHKHHEWIIATLLLALLLAAALLVLLYLHFRLRNAHRYIARQAAETKTLLDTLADGILVQRCRDDVIEYANPAALSLLGYTLSELRSLTAQMGTHNLLHPTYPDGTPYPPSACPIHQSCHDLQIRHTESWFYTKKGTLVPIFLGVAPVTLASGEAGVVSVITDLRERKRLEAELHFAATHDPLTKLLNRRGFEIICAQEAARLHRSGKAAALALLDLDRFKRLNDTYGHAAGDAVLERFAEILRQSLRTTDFIVRWGGEEILVLMPETPLDAAVQAIARCLDSWSKESWSFPPPPLTGFTFSAGIALWEVGNSFDVVLRAADDALYRAKAAGRNRIETASSGTPLPSSPSNFSLQPLSP
ncbi:MAG: diguanylate cyclase [Hydrogenophilus sp.]|nr:diguanylate cyclase [Hydrogenophilus sp.]